MRKFKIILFFIIVFIPILSLTVYGVEDLEINSEAGILIEQNSGTVVYEKNSEKKMYPASTTKIMTAILVLEKCKLDDIVTVSENAVNSIPAGYVKGGIYAGEQLTVNDLLYELMLKSANDVAVVLAEHVSGSVEEFGKLMTNKAKEIGCKNTNFVNPNGIHNENHYSTAYDMALIAEYCMKNETFRKIVSTQKYSLPKTNKYNFTDRSFTNTNLLIDPSSKYYYEYCTGIKTGYTSQAKSCLISSSEKNNVSFISVVLGGNNNVSGKDARFTDTIDLFNYGFDNYKFTEFKKENEIIEKIEVENATKETKELNLKIKDSITPFTKNDFNFENLKPEIKLKENILAPINENDVLGTISYEIEGITYESKILSANNVEEQTYYFLYIIIGSIVLIFGIIILSVSKKSKKKKSKNQKKRTRKYKR